MIKITSELKTPQGFATKVAVLEITSYTLTETVQVSTSVPSTGAFKSLTINVAVYKSAADKEAGEQPMQPKGFPYNFMVTPASEDIITVDYIYSKVLSELNAKDYTASLV